MPALALADVLQDFGGRQRPSAPLAAPEQHAEPLVPVRAPEANALDTAVEEAKQEIAARLEAEHAAAIETLKESHRQEIARLLADIGERAGGVVVEGFTQMEKHLVELTSSVAARILGIALTEDVQAKALEALAAAISDAARDREAVRIRIRGPQSLYEALHPQLGRHAEQVEFTEAAAFDLTAAIDDTLFETRLSEWSTALSEILA